MPQDWRILVVVDRDDDDCRMLKARLDLIAGDCGLRTDRTRTDWQLVNRLAIEELEAWYFGDWSAVRMAYPRVSATIPGQAKYRRPDEIAGGTWEALERILKKAGYFKTGLRKIEAARSVALHMAPDRNVSPSFQALREVLRELRQT